MGLPTCSVEKSICSFLEFHNLILQNWSKLRIGRAIYRGNGNFYHRLVPGVGRKKGPSQSQEKLLRYEKVVFDEFKRGVGAYKGVVPKNDFELLALAQSHGLPTRLLDWTENPYFALYFAVATHKNKDGRVTMYRSSKRLPQTRIDKGKPFNNTKLHIYTPQSISARIRAQRGIFTLHPNICNGLDDEYMERYLPKNSKDWKLDSVKIDSKYKPEIRKQLYKIGIHEEMLFPDLDGFSRHVAWKHFAFSKHSRGHARD